MDAMLRRRRSIGRCSLFWMGQYGDESQSAIRARDHVDVTEFWTALLIFLRMI